jgi:two-component system sensor histidine kinase BarA
VKDRAGAIERAARDGNLASLADGASGLDDLLARTVSALHLRLGLRAESGPDETAREQGALERC